MRILGIDPGLTRCGIGLIDAEDARRPVFRHVEVARTSPDAEISERVHAIATGVAAAVDGWKPDHIAIERVFSQQNLPTVMGVAHVVGAVMVIAGDRRLPLTLYTPTQVKAAVSGYGGASKAQVQAMVQRVLGLEAPPRPADAADALAIAICHAWHRGAANVAAAADRAGAGGATSAQRMWREAESRARRGR